MEADYIEVDVIPQKHSQGNSKSMFVRIFNNKQGQRSGKEYFEHNIELFSDMKI
jgi:hypothetical protein